MIFHSTGCFLHNKENENSVSNGVLTKRYSIFFDYIVLYAYYEKKVNFLFL